MSMMSIRFVIIWSETLRNEFIDIELDDVGLFICVGVVVAMSFALNFSSGYSYPVISLSRSCSKIIDSPGSISIERSIKAWVRSEGDILELLDFKNQIGWLLVERWFDVTFVLRRGTVSRFRLGVGSSNGI